MNVCMYVRVCVCVCIWLIERYLERILRQINYSEIYYGGREAERLSGKKYARVVPSEEIGEGFRVERLVGGVSGVGRTPR